MLFHTIHTGKEAYVHGSSTSNPLNLDKRTSAPNYFSHFLSQHHSTYFLTFTYTSTYIMYEI
jgi:hypothetical protein